MAARYRFSRRTGSACGTISVSPVARLAAASLLVSRHIVMSSEANQGAMRVKCPEVEPEPLRQVERLPARQELKLPLAGFALGVLANQGPTSPGRHPQKLVAC